MFSNRSCSARRASIPSENAEARGLLGRVYKQLYINAVPRRPQSRPAFLSTGSICNARSTPIWGFTGRRRRGHLWHGINAAALGVRAVRDDVSLREAFDGPRPCPRDPRDDRGPGRSGRVGSWRPAAEAWLALGAADKALQWIARYVASRRPTHSSSRARSRQLKEIWGLTIDTMPGSLVLPLLQAQLLHAHGRARRPRRR